jgi:lysyl-tRNA synthetase class 2
MADDKALKACFKEGGKEGVNLQGMEALGGVKFFHVRIESANGDFVLLEKVMEGANVPVDEAAEERKGGAGEIAKALLSAGDKQLAMLVHAPKALQEEKSVTLKEWVLTLLKALGAGEEAIVELGEEYAKAAVAADPDAGKFPLKMRDEAASAGYNFLVEKGLVPPAEDSDDEYVDYAAAAGVEW